MVEVSELLRVVDLLLAAALNDDWTRPVPAIASLFGADTDALHLAIETDEAALLFEVRPGPAQTFESRSIATMRMLQPHLLRVAQIRQRLDAVELERRQARDALAHLDQGVLLVDAQARVRHANRVAEALLATGDGLVAATGSLSCERAADSRALRRLIGAAAEGRLAAPEAVLAVRRSTGRPLSVLVAPMGRDDPWQQGSPASVIVVVTDPERIQADGAARLARRYGLTPAEARAALALLDGGGLSAVAERLSVRLSTVRTLVHRAFAKTGTHRQAELVRLIAAPEAPVEREA